jgi:hypothetical protein
MSDQAFHDAVERLIAFVRRHRFRELTPTEAETLKRLDGMVLNTAPGLHAAYSRLVAFQDQDGRRHFGFARIPFVGFWDAEYRQKTPEKRHYHFQLVPNKEWFGVMAELKRPGSSGVNGRFDDQMSELRGHPTGKPLADECSKIDLAIAVRSAHTEWTDQKVADKARVNRSYMVGHPRYKAAKKAIRDAGKQEIRRAKKGRSSDMDEYADDE